LLLERAVFSKSIFEKSALSAIFYSKNNVFQVKNQSTNKKNHAQRQMVFENLPAV